MALLSSSYDIEKVLDLRFSYDDGSISSCKLHVGDIATIVYNRSGKRDEITGKVVRIEAGTHYELPKVSHVCQPGLVDSCDKNYWYIIVDCSLYNDSNTKKIEVKKILGCEILKRNESVTAVTSPLGTMNITDVRLAGNIFEISLDHQHTWIQLIKVPETLIDVDPELRPIVDKIAASIPGSVNPADKEKMIMEIIESMKEEGQIIINKNDCKCECNTAKEPEDEETVDKVPATTMQPQLNVGALVATVIDALKEQGLVGKSPDSGDETDPDLPKAPELEIRDENLLTD